MRPILFIILFALSSICFDQSTFAQGSYAKTKNEQRSIKQEEKKRQRELKIDRKNREREARFERQKIKPPRKFDKGKNRNWENTKKSKDKINRVKNVPKSSASSSLRASLTEEARSFIGKKYTFGGETPKEGFDCSGFVQYVLKSESIFLPRTAAEQSTIGTKIKWQDAQKGDLIFFAGKGQKISHVGLVLSNDSKGIQMIHSASSTGVTITIIQQSSYWMKQVRFARNVVGR